MGFGAGILVGLLIALIAVLAVLCWLTNITRRKFKQTDVEEVITEYVGFATFVEIILFFVGAGFFMVLLEQHRVWLAISVVAWMAVLWIIDTKIVRRG